MLLVAFSALAAHTHTLVALPANRSSFSVMPFLVKAKEAVPCRLIIRAVAKKVPRMVMGTALNSGCE